MKRFLIAAALVAAVAAPAYAALAPGAAAPDFKLPAALDGKDYSFDLAAALKKGPVVVYFYPKAFTGGCSAEAHEFAENMPKFKAMGASVIGVSHDDIATLKKFSVEKCQSAFPVAADTDGKVIKAYDAKIAAPMGLMLGSTDASNRTSYVVAPDGKVIYAYSDLGASKHVANTLDALKTWRDAHKS